MGTVEPVAHALDRRPAEIHRAEPHAPFEVAGGVPVVVARMTVGERRADVLDRLARRAARGRLDQRPVEIGWRALPRRLVGLLERVAEQLVEELAVIALVIDSVPPEPVA